MRFRYLLSAIVIVLIAYGFSAEAFSQSKTTRSTTGSNKPTFIQPSRNQNGSQQELYRVSRQARNAETSGNLEKALELWQAVHAIRPGYFSAYGGIRRCLIGLGRYDEAIGFLDEILELSQSGKAQIDPVTIAADRVEIVFASQDKEAGMREVDKVIAEYKGNEKIYRDLSGVLSAQRLSDEAISILLQGRKDCGNPFLFARDLARWYEARMDWKSACEEYLLNLEESPNNLSYITGAFGDMASEPNADSLTVKVIEKTLKKADKPYQIILHRLLASLHFRAQRYEEALEQYQFLERQSGDQGKELLEFAKLTYSEGEYSLAQRAFAEILAANPRSKLRASVLIGIGMTAESMGEIDSAMTAYQEVLKPGVMPTEAFEAYSRLGQIEFNHQINDAKAREYFEKAIELGKKSRISTLKIDEIQILKALTFEREGKLAEAERDLKSIIRLTGRQRQSASNARLELAMLYYRKGDLENMEKEITDLLNSAPSSKEANDALELKALIEDLKDSQDVIKTLGAADYAMFCNKSEEAVKLLRYAMQNGNEIAQEAVLWNLYRISTEKKQYLEALDYLEKIINMPSPLRGDLALLTAGQMCTESLHDAPKAIIYYEKLLINFPDSPLADQVRRHLSKLEHGLL